jgi:protein-S-isoprenylcysteine O-methyltransferase Ste14
VLNEWWLGGAWVLFFATFYVSHRQVRAAVTAPEKRIRRERSSDVGMALQFAAVLLAAALPGPWHASTAMAGLMLAAVSIAWLHWSLKHLDRQWRVQAVITEDHELITTGPYRIVRHPVYLAFLGMTVATILMRGNFAERALALAVFAAGTEIRVSAEERLLRAAFGYRFSDYVNLTQWAYLPWIR